MKDKKELKWLDVPQDADYPAALSYLTLVSTNPDWKMRDLKNAEVVPFKAKDILRASGLKPIGISQKKLEEVRLKIKNGEALSPLLLVRDFSGGRVTIASGFHTLCAAFEHDEDAVVPCKIA